MTTAILSITAVVAGILFGACVLFQAYWIWASGRASG
jgi:hypothetical protein